MQESLGKNSAKLGARAGNNRGLHQNSRKLVGIGAQENMP